MDFVEQFGLQNPLLLFAPASQAIDPVTQRTVAGAVKQLRDPRRKPPVRFGPGHPLVQVHQMALVDAGGRRVDDDEHLGGEILGAAIEDDARHADVPRLVRVRPLVKQEGRQPVLPVNDQELFLRLLQPADTLLAERVETQLLRREEQHRSR